MTSRPFAGALTGSLLVLGLAATPGLAQSLPSLSLGEGCMLAATPTPNVVCEPRMLTFAFDGIRAVDPMDLSGPQAGMIGATARLPFLTTDESTLIARWPQDLNVDPESTGSISGADEMKR